MTDLSSPIYHDEEAARLHLEALRWANGRFCPHCGATEATSPVASKKHAPGLYFCNACSKTFTVRVGTLFERSHVALHKWVLAFELMAASKKGMSAHQLHRMLGVTYKTAWFMAHRIREAMQPDGYQGPMGSAGGFVEADETFIGGKKENRHKGERSKAKMPPKQVVFALVERDGSARSFHVATVSGRTLKPILRQQVSQSAHLRTDESHAYHRMRRDFASHERVNHSREEYVRGDAHTNTVEGYFSILKRGIYGVYHHVSPAHLKRYLSEFDFRYTHRKIEDTERAELALKGIEGKRLTYRRTA
jgi:transposase-like protein